MPPTAGELAKLEAAQRATWAAIGQARRRAIETRDELGRLVREARAVPQDAAFIVFGSLAREEVSEGSDVDWALLIDGPADDGHSSTVHGLRALLRERKYEDPGTGGLFGGLAISHELVHRIGGDSDSNRNITQRILLLLESRAPMATDVVRTRVLRVLLTRYLVDDFGYPMPPKHAAAGVPGGSAFGGDGGGLRSQDVRIPAILRRQYSSGHLGLGVRAVRSKFEDRG